MAPSRTPPPASTPRVRLRPVEDGDVPEVLALNEHEVRHLSPLDAPRLDLLRILADRFDVVEVEDPARGPGFAGFVVTFAPGTSYDSENYRWFTDRYGGRCYYLDRIVLTAGARGRGVGRAVYADLEPIAAPYGRLTLEVNLVPPNPGSLAFHDALGYVEVGRLGDAEHLVSLRAKEL